MSYLFFHKLLILLISTIGPGLGILVYRNRPSERIGRLFLAISFFMLGWVDFAFFARLSMYSSSTTPLYFLRIAWFITPLFFSLLYLLIVEIVPKKSSEGIYKILNTVVVIWAIVVSLITLFSNLTIRRIFITNDNLSIVYGSGTVLFLGFGMFLISITLYLLFRAYIGMSSDKKLKIQYFFVGLIIFYLANILFNIILPIFFQKTDLYYLGDYSTIILLFFLAYAIIKRELFNIKVVLTEILIGTIAILLFIDLLVSQSIFEYLWKGILFVAFLIFGKLLIKSIVKEIKQKEQLDNLATKLATNNVRLQAAYKKLQRLDKAKTEFISIASHQLRTPLTAIKGYSSMILEGDYGETGERVKHAVKNVYQSSERLVKLVNNLLNISRLEAGRIKLEEELIDFDSLIGEVIEELAIEARGKNLYLKKEREGEKVGKIILDQEKIRQVLLNIIDNAIKYTPKGGITLKYGKEGEKVKIAITDTGQGMTKEEIENLFRRFVRGSAGQRSWTEGAGLGLYIAKKYVELQGGKIWAESLGKGKGSTFYIELPLKKK